MLQVDINTYASDALADAMCLAQTKALNSYTYSDCLSYLNYAWSDIYSRMACIDDGYYGVNVRLTSKLTKLPPYVKNSIQVYEAQTPTDRRDVYRCAGYSDMNDSRVYKISGTELFCPDAERRTIWLYYAPACPQVFFTHHNRDPKLKLYEEVPDTIRSNLYNIYQLHAFKVVDDAVVEVDFTDATVTPADLEEVTSWQLIHRKDATNITDITDVINIEGDELEGNWKVNYISCKYPYIFVSYKNDITEEYKSVIFDKNMTMTVYNPFDFTGKPSNVEYIQCDWNDKTGMGVIVKDYNDTYTDTTGAEPVVLPKIKELGWTPDTIIKYPAPEVYRYLVARLADKFSALNESNVMGVQKELVEARFAFEAFLNKNKAGWERITNVNKPTIGDWL